MFRSIRNTQITVAGLAAAALALTFAAGCTNSVVGPESHASASAPRNRVPAEVAAAAEKAGVTPSVNPLLPGDITGDGHVDASDLAAFAFLMRADLNRDEVVDGLDQVALAAVLNGQIADVAAPMGVIDASDYAAYAALRGRADLNRDGYVDASDLAAFNWMRDRGDLDGDGIVSRRDRHIIAPEVTP